MRQVLMSTPMTYTSTAPCPLRTPLSKPQQTCVLQKTAGESGVVTLGVAVVSESNTGVVTFTAAKEGTATYSVSISDAQGNLSQTTSYTFTVAKYGEDAPAAPASTTAGGLDE